MDLGCVDQFLEHGHQLAQLAQRCLACLGQVYSGQFRVSEEGKGAMMGGERLARTETHPSWPCGSSQ